MSKIDLIIDALLVAPPSVWSARMNEALFAARELKAELENRQWVGLTDKEIADFSNWLSCMNLVKAVEAKLKEKNT